MRRVLVTVLAGLIPAMVIAACSSTPNPPPLDCDGPCPTQPPKDATADKKDVATVDAPGDAPSDADAGVTDAHADGDAGAAEAGDADAGAADSAADASTSDAADAASDAALASDSDAAP